MRHILISDYGVIIDAINRMTLLGYCVGEANPEAYASPGANRFPPDATANT